jgi:hypothetical protein
VPTTCQNLGGCELWLCLGTPAIITYVWTELTRDILYVPA